MLYVNCVAKCIKRVKLQLLPLKYGVKLDGEDSIISGIPASDLM